MPVGLRVGGILAQHVQRREVTVVHGLKHIAQVPATLGLDLRTPGFFKLGPQGVVLNMLKASKAVWNGTHVAATLDVVLSAQRIHATAVAANVSGEQRQVDEGHHVVHSVVMLSDTESPTYLGAGSAAVCMSHPPDG